MHQEMNEMCRNRKLEMGFGWSGGSRHEREKQKEYSWLDDTGALTRESMDSTFGEKIIIGAISVPDAVHCTNVNCSDPVHIDS